MERGGELSPRERLLHLRSFFGGEVMLAETMYEMALVGSERRFTAGQLIQSADEVCETSFFVIEGTVAVQLMDAEPYQMIAPASAGFLALLAGMKRGVEIISTTDTLCLVHEAREMRQILERDPEQLVNLLRANARALVSLNNGGFMAGDPDVSPVFADLTSDASFVELLLAMRLFPLFATTNMDGIASVARAARVRKVPAGTVLWQANAPASEFVHVVNGSFRIQHTSEQQDFIVESGFRIGLMDRVLAGSRDYSATCETDATVLSWDADAWFATMEDHLDLTWALLGAVAAGIIDALRRGGVPMTTDAISELSESASKSRKSALPNPSEVVRFVHNSDQGSAVIPDSGAGLP